MNRFCLWNRRYLYGGLFFYSKDEFAHDRLGDSPEFVPTNGFERVYDAFRDREPGYSSKAMNSVLQMMGGSFCFGFIIGGIKKGNHAYSNFIVAHQHAKFISPYEAKRKLQDTVMLNFMKGGVFWGTKVALFSGIFSFCVIAIPLFRNTSEGILEYIIGGAVAGGLSRLYLGVKATLSGATLVAILAGIVGLFTFLSPTSMSDIRDMQYALYEWRKNRIDMIVEYHRKRSKGWEITDFLRFREVRSKTDDDLGYSQVETAYVAVTDPDEVSESNKPEVEDKKSNEQPDSNVTAGVQEKH